jgi:hypothetical protein
MQVEQQDKTDHDPNVKNEIDAAADGNQGR